jgi:hypothetical protein
MHAGFDLRLGSHTGQGTRYGPKSVLISERRRTIAVSPKHLACNAKGIVCAGELITF